MTFRESPWSGNFAQEIINASTTNEAKEIASRVPRGQHKDWHSIKCQVMKEILRAKSDYSPLFRSALLNSVGKQIVEYTQDLFWRPDLPFFGHADPLDGWRCCSQKRVLSRPIQVQQL